MSDRIRHRSSRRRVQLPPSPGRNTKHEPARRQSWAGLSTQEILARYKPGTAPPLKVLDVLIDLFNTLHTSLEKTVSHKTRQERAQFLRRFFRDLSQKAGFKMAPDPRNLGQKHIHAMVQVWHDERLAPATIRKRSANPPLRRRRRRAEAWSSMRTLVKRRWARWWLAGQSTSAAAASAGQRFSALAAARTRP